MKYPTLRATLVLVCLLLLPLGVQTFAQKKSSAPAGSVSPEATPNWIWLNAENADDQTIYFRKTITTRGRITGAKLYATCDNEMTIFLNGKQVLQSGNFTQPVFADVLNNMKRGKNVLAVRAKNSGGPGGLLVKFDLDSSESKKYSFITDESWKVSEKPPKPNWKNANFNDKGWAKPTVIAKLGGGPWATTVTAAKLAALTKLREPTATPVKNLKVAKGFKVELLYSVPKDEQGSWVNLTADPKGRLIVSDQYGGLYRVTPPALNGDPADIKIEKINVDLGEAQGLLWAFDSLYVSVNTGGKYESGIYRVTDADGDDNLDTVKQLRKLQGGGEHGPHAILLSPEGDSLYIVCGNGTKLTEMENSRVPRVWDEDQILPRTYGRGFMKGVPAPGGYINKMDPEGKNWELIANGFRNEFDAAFNLSGELFTYDADMEWDMNTPWYRPTRVCHVVSGAEFGWRNGSGKWPAYYPDSVPAVVNVGPGSPTGITFGYGAKFPAKFQNSLFISDWSYGVLYAVDMKSEGASYQGSLTKFITGTPLPLTDVIINPHDGAMYFAIGGRRTKSGLYRVTYTGTESTEPVKPNAVGSEARKLRKTLEAFHGHQDEKAVAVAWPHLSSADRFIRWAARIAIEHQPVETWQDRALSEENPQALLEAIIALTRHGDKLLQPKILKSLQRIQWDQLNHHQKISLVRAYSLTFTRMGTPTDAAAKSVIGQLDPHFPADSRELNNELCQLMVYLQSDTAAAKSVALLSESPTQEEQIAFAKSIRHLKTGWTPELRKEYFSWFVKAAGYRGGASFGLFVQHIKADAVANLSDEEKTALKPILEAKPKNTGPIINPIQRPFVKKWTMEELVPLVTNGLKGRDFNKGRKLFAAANCFACHRFDNEGGAIGPDLTILSGRFTSRDILESVIEPSKVISDQYAAVSILTTDGKQINGRIVNLAGDSLQINTNMLDPNAQVGVDRKMIDEMFPSKTSMMPQGLMDTLKREEVLDLMAYLLSRGNRNHEMFKK